LECFGVEEMAVPLFDVCTHQPMTVVSNVKENCEKMLDSDPLARRLALQAGTRVRIDSANGYGPPCTVYRQVVAA